MLHCCTALLSRVTTTIALALLPAVCALAATESVDSWSLATAQVPPLENQLTDAVPLTRPGADAPLLLLDRIGAQYRGILLELPAPAAAWLFGSAVIGLSVVARRRRRDGES